MKAYFRCFSVVVGLLAATELAHCSHGIPDQDQGEDKGPVSFKEYSDKEYSEGRENLRVVLGCGREHKKKTSGGFEHNHPDAYTINLKPDPGSQNSWGVSHPHRYGNALEEKTWKDIPESCLGDITAEHVVLFSQPDLRVTRRFVEKGLEVKKAKKKAEYLNFDWLVDRAARHLKPGGTLTFLPAFHPHSIADFWCKGLFEELLDYPRSFYVEDDTASLLSSISDFFPFDRGFSHMRISFYEVKGKHSSERVPTELSRYCLNMSSDAEEKSAQKNKETVRSICKDRHVVNFVTVTLVKAKGSNEG